MNPLPLDSETMPLWSRAGFLIRRLNQIHYAMFLSECEEFDLTPVQYGILTELREHPDIDQISLGDAVSIEKDQHIRRRVLKESYACEARPPVPPSVLVKDGRTLGTRNLRGLLIDVHPAAHAFIYVFKFQPQQPA